MRDLVASWPGPIQVQRANPGIPLPNRGHTEWCRRDWRLSLLAFRLIRTNSGKNSTIQILSDKSIQLRLPNPGKPLQVQPGGPRYKTAWSSDRTRPSWRCTHWSAFSVADTATPSSPPGSCLATPVPSPVTSCRFFRPLLLTSLTWMRAAGTVYRSCPVRDDYNLKSRKCVCITSFHPDTKSNPNPNHNPNPNPNPTATIMFARY